MTVNMLRHHLVRVITGDKTPENTGSKNLVLKSFDLSITLQIPRLIDH